MPASIPKPARVSYIKQFVHNHAVHVHGDTEDGFAYLERRNEPVLHRTDLCGLCPMRRSVTHATECAVEAVQLCYRAAGGTAVYESAPFERALRDVNAAATHRTTRRVMRKRPAALRTEQSTDPPRRGINSLVGATPPDRSSATRAAHHPARRATCHSQRSPCRAVWSCPATPPPANPPKGCNRLRGSHPG
jgi:hypothetical protein